MSTAKTGKEKIKEAIFAIGEILFGKQKFMAATLSDGKAIKIEGESIAEGAAVSYEDGTPVPDGEYTLQDGTVIMCAEGKIKSVKNPEPAPAEMSAEAVAKIVQKATEETMQKVNEKFTAQEKEIATLKEQKKSYDAAFQKVLDVVQVLADTAAAEPLEPQKKTFKREEDEDPAEKMRELRQAFANYLKKKAQGE